MTQPQLQQALANALGALVQLQTGAKVVSVSYAQGDGSQSVTYSATNIAGLTQFIIAPAQLGIPGMRRQALRPIF
jgi:hypothetical protein